MSSSSPKLIISKLKLALAVGVFAHVHIVLVAESYSMLGQAARTTSGAYSFKSCKVENSFRVNLSTNGAHSLQIG